MGRTTSNRDSIVIAHARRELELAGAFTKTEHYDGFIGKGTLSLIKIFDHYCQGDGKKMEILRDYFTAVASGGLLSPVTDDPAEWKHESKDGKDFWRNQRNPFYISIDQGKSWTNVQINERGISRDHKEVIDEQAATTQGGAHPNEKASDTSTSQSSNKKSSSNSKVGKGSTGKTKSDAASTTPGSKLNTRVADQGTQDSKKSQSRTAKPKGGENK